MLLDRHRAALTASGGASRWTKFFHDDIRHYKARSLASGDDRRSDMS